MPDFGQLNEDEKSNISTLANALIKGIVDYNSEILRRELEAKSGGPRRSNLKAAFMRKNMDETYLKLNEVLANNFTGTELRSAQKYIMEEVKEMAILSIVQKCGPENMELLEKTSEAGLNIVLPTDNHDISSDGPSR